LQSDPKATCEGMRVTPKLQWRAWDVANARHIGYLCGKATCYKWNKPKTDHMGSKCQDQKGSIAHALGSSHNTTMCA
jgi:hypothetical protein